MDVRNVCWRFVQQRLLVLPQVATVPIKGDRVFLRGDILSLYPSLNVSPGALSAFLSACLRKDTDIRRFFGGFFVLFFFPEIHPREAHQSSAHISAMNKTLLVLKESTAQGARDLNRATRRGSAVCLIWTSPTCLCSILLPPTSGGGREKSLSH